MNRKERRRNGITQKPATLCIKENELQQELSTLSKAVKEETIKQTIELVTGTMALALNNEFQFGATRINRLISRINTELECIHEGHLSRDDVQNWCKDNDINLEG